MFNTQEVKLSKKTIFYILSMIILFAFLARIIPGFTFVPTTNYYNGLDYYNDLDFYIKWSTQLHNGFFNAYEHIERLDYPPIWLFPLYIVGFFTNIVEIQESQQYMMFFLRIFQILFDVAIIPTIYFTFKKKNQILSLIMAASWAINPATIMNSSYWGQTDSLMILFLLITFYFIEEKKLIPATIWYCIACLTKFQCLFFAPVFCLYMFFSKYHWKTILKAIIAGISTILIVFLPFMLHSGIMLPFKIYFGGYDSYTAATLNAFNFYGAMMLNGKSDATTIAGIPCSIISTVMVTLAIILIVFLYFKAPKKNSWILCFMLMQTIFMFMTRMHERYQIPVLIFSLGVIIFNNSHRFINIYIIQTAIVFINEALIFFTYFLSQPIASTDFTGQLICLFSMINYFVYIWTMYISFSEIYGKEQKFLLKKHNNT